LKNKQPADEYTASMEVVFLDNVIATANGLASLKAAGKGKI
jgi:hypothetical protein